MLLPRENQLTKSGTCRCNHARHACLSTASRATRQRRRDGGDGGGGDGGDGGGRQRGPQTCGVAVLHRHVRELTRCCFKSRVGACLLERGERVPAVLVEGGSGTRIAHALGEEGGGGLSGLQARAGSPDPSRGTVRSVVTATQKRD